MEIRNLESLGALSSVLATLGTLQLRALGFLNSVFPLTRRLTYMYRVNNQFADASINGRLYREKMLLCLQFLYQHKRVLSWYLYSKNELQATNLCDAITSTVRAPPTILQTNLSSVSSTWKAKAFFASPTQHGTK